MWRAEGEGGRSRWGEEEGKKRARGRMGVGGRKGGRRGREEEERAGRALFVVLWTGHSGVIKKQERKEMRPGAEGLGCAQTCHTQLAAAVLTTHQGSGCSPHKWGPLLLSC